jgi:uncharacterized protein (DUF302 family)
MVRSGSRDYSDTWSVRFCGRFQNRPRVYLVGNPLIATEVIGKVPRGSLFAPFQTAIYEDQSGVHLSYMLPSSLFTSLDDRGAAAIGDLLDAKVEETVAQVCELV